MTLDHQLQHSRRLIHRIFAKQYGLTLHVDAVDLLLQTLHQYGLLSPHPSLSDDQDDVELNQTLHTIAAACRRDAATSAPTSSAQNSSTPHATGHGLLSAARLDNVLQRLKNNANQSAYSSFGTPSSQPDGAPSQSQFQPQSQSQFQAPADDIDLPSLFHVLSAFHLPRWRYSPESKAFLRIDKPSPTGSAMTPYAPAKPSLFRDRFELIRQRTLRNPNFRPATFSSLAGPSAPQAGGGGAGRLLSLTPISSLRGNEGKAFYLFGMLSRLDHGAGKVYLEDGSASVELDLSQTSTGIGFFTETCFVIVQGMYTADKVFFVHAISMPPAESRQATFEAFGQLDFLGAPLDVYDTAQLEAIEHQFAHNAIYVLSDVHLDHKPTMDALHLLLSTLNASPTPPLALLLLGNFSSTPPTQASHAAYRDLWTALATVLADFPRLLAHTTFVLLPGPTDPWNPHLHPRAPLPATLVGKALSRLGARIELATSPCRIKYCTLELVVGRGEYVGRMRRNDVVKVAKMRGARERAAAAAAQAQKATGGRPTRGREEAQEREGPEEVVVSQGLAGSQVETTSHSYHFTRTIIDQAHLLPLPLDVQPVMWDFDHVNRLYPLPHVVVAADASDTEAYVEGYAGVTVVNPGSFSHSGARTAGAEGRFTYAKVVPGVRRVELEAVYSSSGF